MDVFIGGVVLDSILKARVMGKDLQEMFLNLEYKSNMNFILITNSKIERDQDIPEAVF